MAKLMTPKTWGGNNINDGVNYEARFVIQRQELDSVASGPADAVLTTRPGREPLFAFGQLKERAIDLEIQILPLEAPDYENPSLVQTLIDQLKAWFDPEAEEQELVVTDANEIDTSILAMPEDVQPYQTATIWRIRLKAAKAKRESTSVIEEEFAVTSDTPFTVVNPGSARVRPVITLTPDAAMGSGDGPTTVTRHYVANRSVQPLTDFNGEKYPILFEGTAGDDLRVFLNGEEQPRWAGSGGFWVNLHMRPGKFATLSLEIDGADTQASVTDPTGFLGWPNEGWTFIEDEPVRYALIDDFTAILAYRPEPTTHAAGSALIWIEHLVDVVTGESSPDTAPTWLDSRPRINLDDSNNQLHIWDGGEDFLPDHDRRSRSWRRVTEAEQSPNVRLYNDSGTMVFEDLPPETGKPLGDTAEMRFPVPIISPLTYDSDIGLTLHQLITAYDIGGYFSELVSELWSDGMQTGLEADLSNPATLIRIKSRVAAILGEVNDDEGFLAMDLTSGSLGKLLPTDTSDPPTTAILYGLLHVSIHFILEEDTEVNAIMVQFSDGADEVNGWFFKGGEKALEMQLWGVTFPATDGWRFVEVTAGGDSTRGRVLAAGEYWLSFEQGSGQLKGVARSKANIYGGQMIWPAELLTPNTPVPDGDRLYIGADITVDDEVPDNLITSNMTPLFAILSKKAEPQADAPLETGYQIVVDNISAPLDPDTAPKIYAAADEPLFFLNHTIHNNSTGEDIDVSFPCRADEGLEIDCDTGIALDLQTGEKVSWAINFAGRSMFFLQPGENEIEIQGQAGISGGLTAAFSYKAAYN